MSMTTASHKCRRCGRVLLRAMDVGQEILFCFPCSLSYDVHGQPMRFNVSLGMDTGTAKPAKYHNVKTTVDGQVFDSTKEAGRYKELTFMQKAGEITALQRQVTFHLPAETRYIADFVYLQDQQWVVEDVKSDATKTAAYRIKKRLMLETHGIEIKEV